eukprot:1778787-Rhodomonas_salina.2
MMLVMAMMLMVVVVVLMTIRMISACALRRAAYLDAEEVVEERADEVVVQESLGLRRRDQEGQDAQLLRARLAWLWTPDTHAQCQRPANTTHNTSCLNATLGGAEKGDARVCAPRGERAPHIPPLLALDPLRPRLVLESEHQPAPHRPDDVRRPALLALLDHVHVTVVALGHEQHRPPARSCRRLVVEKPRR